MRPTRVAAIDCGTNSIRLLVADVDVAAGTARDVVRRTTIVRLGEGVEATGAFAPAALDRTFAACQVYADLIRAAGGPPLRFVATSATRDVTNRDAFVAGVRARLGVDPEVISGTQEALLSFEGATRGLPPDASAPFLVVDIGGGSTEFVHGAGSPDAHVSVDVGCVRLTERHALADPPTRDQVAAMTADVDAALQQAAASVALAKSGTLVGLSGTVITVAAIALALPRYDEAVLHHARITAEQVHSVADRLLGMTRAERMALPAMVAGREDVIGAGALVLDRIVAVTGAHEVLVSAHDLLDGVAWSVAGTSAT